MKQVPRYPKTQSIWKRNMRTFCDCADLVFDNDLAKCPYCGEKTHKIEGHGLIIPNAYTWDEFESINRWHVTEKIHGQNIRIGFHNNDLGIPKEVSFWGRRAGESSVQKDLLPHLKAYFTAEMLQEVFPIKEHGVPVEVVLYGEGYGNKIQSWHYGLEEESSFILFDVLIGHTWLTQEAVTSLAKELGVERVPVLSESMSTLDAVLKCAYPFESTLCPGHPAEGIVARSQPLVLHRYKKTPIQWKLKCEDYRKFKQFRLTGVVTESKTWGIG